MIKLIGRIALAVSVFMLYSVMLINLVEDNLVHIPFYIRMTILVFLLTVGAFISYIVANAVVSDSAEKDENIKM